MGNVVSVDVRQVAPVVHSKVSLEVMDLFCRAFSTGIAEKYEFLSRAIEMDNKFCEAYFWRGSILLHSRSSKNSKKDIKTALSLAPTEYMKLVVQSFILETKGDKSGAVCLLDQANAHAKDDREKAEIAYMKAILFWNKGNRVATLQFLQLAYNFKVYRKSSLEVLIAQYYMEDDNKSMTTSWFKKALNIAPTAYVLDNYCDFVQKSDKKEALKIAEKMIELYPNDPCGYAQKFWITKDLEIAKIALEKDSKYNTNEYTICLVTAILADNRRHMEAISILDTQIDIYQKHNIRTDKLWRLKGDFLTDLKEKRAEALDCLRKAVLIHPNYSENQISLAQALLDDDPNSVEGLQRLKNALTLGKKLTEKDTDRLRDKQIPEFAFYGTEDVNFYYNFNDKWYNTTEAYECQTLYLLIKYSNKPAILAKILSKYIVHLKSWSNSSVNEITRAKATEATSILQDKVSKMSVEARVPLSIKPVKVYLGEEKTVFDYAFNGDLKSLKEWVSSQPNLEEALSVIDKQHNNATLLYTASTRGHLEMVKWLIKQKANVNATQGHNSTPLHGACFRGHIEVCKILLANSADTSILNANGESPLDNAADYPNIKELFLNKGDGKGYNQRVTDVICDMEFRSDPIEGLDDVPLVSFDEALAPLIGIVDKLDKYQFLSYSFAQQQSTEMIKTFPKITVDGIAAINLYTRNWSDGNSLYAILNSKLRAENRIEIKPYFRFMKLLLTALSSLPNAAGTVVWRGITGDYTDLYSKGKKFIWWGFSSCSKILSVVKTFTTQQPNQKQTLFNIQFKLGSEISLFSSYKIEEEILLPPGAYFVVCSCETFDNLTIVHIEEQLPPVAFLDVQFHPSIQNYF